MSNKLIILGAGASVDFLSRNQEPLTTSSLTNAILRKSLWEEVFVKIQDFLGDKMRNINFQVDDFFFLIQDFQDNFDSLYDNQKRSSPVLFNFEKIVAYLDFVAIYIQNQNSSSISEFNPAYHLFRYCNDCDSRLRKVTKISENRMIPFLAREVLHDYIHQHSISKDGILFFRKYLKHQIQICDRVNIVSLNYDSLLHEALQGLDCFNGFVRGNFEPSNFMQNKNTVSYIHGHQNFYPSASSIMMSGDSDSGFKCRARNLWTNNYQSIASKSFGLSFITGAFKEKELQMPVFNTYMNKGVYESILADEVILIGYSCSDDHINSIIRNFFDMKKKIVFINPCLDQEVGSAQHGIIRGFLSKGSIEYQLDKVEFNRLKTADYLLKYIDKNLG